MTEYKLFAQRVGLVGVANIIVSLSGLILLPLLTKNLSIEEYGIWVQIGVTIGLLVPLTTLALSTAGHRFLSGEKDKKVVSRGFYSIFAVVFLISFIVSVLIFVFSRPLSIALFGGTEAEYLVKLAAPLILLGGMNSVAFQCFLTFQQVKKYSALLILETVFQILLISCFLLAGFGLFGAIISLLILRLIMLILKSLLIILQIRVSLPSYSLIKNYLMFSIPLVPSTLCYWIFTVSDRYVIGYFLGMASVGVYSASYGIGSMVSLFYGALSIILLPTLSRLYEANKIEEIKTHLKYLSKVYLMLTIPSTFGLTVLSKSLLSTLTTSEFISGFIIIPIIALATIFLNYGSMNANVLILYEKTKIGNDFFKLWFYECKRSDFVRKNKNIWVDNDIFCFA
jgi:O-antigen/teichoic acid export membrane protein